MKTKRLRKLLSLLLVAVLLVSFAAPLTGYAKAGDPEVKGIWISFLEFQTMLTGKSKAQFTYNIATAFDNIKNFGLNTVYVQVRPYSDALYKSDYFPWSHIVTGVEGQNPGYDPLEIMVEEAHNRNLKIEAWINPYRVRPEGNDKPLASSSPAQKWLNQGDRSVAKYGTLITYNPASTKAQDLIVNGVKEIVKNYDVDGIHIDDYFYPYTGTAFDNSFDQAEYNAYNSGGGKLSKADWRRNNVNTLIKKIYKGVKEVNPKVLFGISPQSNIERNYTQQYLDVKEIVTKEGYCDYVAPQIYFGFQHEIQPYGSTWDSWSKLAKDAKVDLYVGVAIYKAGKIDSYAGVGKNEWVYSSNRIATMVDYSRKSSNYDGFILYRYDHMFRPESTVSNHIARERNNLKKII